MKRIAFEILLALTVVAAVTAGTGDSNREFSVSHLRAQIAPGSELVVIGNSMVGEGVDPELLSQALGVRASTVQHGGAASAWWYVALKNHVLTLDPRPRAVVIAFRDSFLTRPTFRVSGQYATHIRALSSPDEPALDTYAWKPALGALRHQLTKHVPAFRRRGQYQRSVDERLGRVPAALLTGLSPSKVKSSLEIVFHDKRFLTGQVTRAQLRAEVSDPVSHLEFTARLRASLLPSMAEAAAQADVPLILVRIRRRAHTAAPDAEAVRAYMADLAAWAKAHGIPLLDFADEERLRLEHFATGDHLGPEGRALFTQLLAERLEPLLRFPPEPGGDFAHATRR